MNSYDADAEPLLAMARPSVPSGASLPDAKATLKRASVCLNATATLCTKGAAKDCVRCCPTPEGES
eukprot:3563282-Pyramimonas_sp.AAC.1